MWLVFASGRAPLLKKVTIIRYSLQGLEKNNDYFTTPYWTWKKSNDYFTTNPLRDSEKSYDDFAHTSCGVLKKVAIISLRTPSGP
jgi:hypothetical protein